MKRDVFSGIADPVRREILFLLAKESLPLNKIADNFSISRPAISKHIRVLKECGLVSVKSKGRENYCSVNAAPLNEVNKWLKHFDRMWDKKLNSLKKYLEDNP